MDGKRGGRGGRRSSRGGIRKGSLPKRARADSNGRASSRERSNSGDRSRSNSGEQVNSRERANSRGRSKGRTNSRPRANSRARANSQGRAIPRPRANSRARPVSTVRRGSQGRRRSSQPRKSLENADRPRRRSSVRSGRPGRNSRSEDPGMARDRAQDPRRPSTKGVMPIKVAPAVTAITPHTRAHPPKELRNRSNELFVEVSTPELVVRVSSPVDNYIPPPLPLISKVKPKKNLALAWQEQSQNVLLRPAPGDLDVHVTLPPPPPPPPPRMPPPEKPQPPKPEPVKKPEPVPRPKFEPLVLPPFPPKRERQASIPPPPEEPLPPEEEPPKPVEPPPEPPKPPRKKHWKPIVVEPEVAFNRFEKPPVPQETVSAPALIEPPRPPPPPPRPPSPPPRPPSPPQLPPRRDFSRVEDDEMRRIRDYIKFWGLKGPAEGSCLTLQRFGIPDKKQFVEQMMADSLTYGYDFEWKLCHYHSPVLRGICGTNWTRRYIHTDLRENNSLKAIDISQVQERSIEEKAWRQAKLALVRDQFNNLGTAGLDKEHGEFLRLIADTQLTGVPFTIMEEVLEDLTPILEDTYRSYAYHFGPNNFKTREVANGYLKVIAKVKMYKAM